MLALSSVDSFALGAMLVLKERLEGNTLFVLISGVDRTGKDTAGLHGVYFSLAILFNWGNPALIILDMVKESRQRKERELYSFTW